MNGTNQDQRNARMRMPTVFGPGGSPRGGTAGQRYDWSSSTRTAASVSFLTEQAALAELLPPGFTLKGEPVVTVEWTELKGLAWLAGRGYNMLGIKYPCEFRGQQDHAHGQFLAVLWENRPEPILTGREELGYAKIYCELPQPVSSGSDNLKIQASWDGHVFASIDLADLADATPPTTTNELRLDQGVLHYRYFPKVSQPGESDIAQAVLTPAGGFTPEVSSFKRGRGNVVFHHSEWEQLPTFHHIVNKLAALPVLEGRGATFVQSAGGKDLSDQRVLA